MYIPPHFRNENISELLAFMKSHPFGIIASNGKNSPVITHLPFVISEERNQIWLTTHLAAGNPHATLLKEGNEALVIFSGPHGYVSPALYEKRENVPTWNYIAVHATGMIHPLESNEKKSAVLMQMVDTFDPAYRSQWDSLDPQYVAAMMNGIYAFRIAVSKLEGKFKLSQNKTRTEQERIAHEFSGSELAEWMNFKRSK